MPLIPVTGPPNPLALALARRLQEEGPAGPSPEEAPPEPSQGEDPLTALQSVIEHLYSVITLLDSPEDTQMAMQALLILTRVQKRLMQEQGG